MQYNKTVEAAGFAGVLSLFLTGSFLLYMTVFRFMIDFLMSYQGTSLHGYR